MHSGVTRAASGSPLRCSHRRWHLHAAAPGFPLPPPAPRGAPFPGQGGPPRASSPSRRLPPGQGRLQPVSFPGCLGARPSGRSSPCRAALPAGWMGRDEVLWGAMGHDGVPWGGMGQPALLVAAQFGGHVPPLPIPTSKPAPVPPTSTTPHLWQASGCS